MQVSWADAGLIYICGLSKFPVKLEKLSDAAPLKSALERCGGGGEGSHSTILQAVLIKYTGALRVESVTVTVG